ncbi:MAG TPA: histidine phosphatase family protein [Acidimicrobiia bacterium]
MRERADQVIADVLEANGPIAIFAHGHLLRILAVPGLGLRAVNGANLRLDTTTVSTLGWERESRVIRHWNEVCHLRSMDPVP